jgi:hypothetical protein
MQSVYFWAYLRDSLHGTTETEIKIFYDIRICVHKFRQYVYTFKRIALGDRMQSYINLKKYVCRE